MERNNEYRSKPYIWNCPSCGREGNTGTFCEGCGKPVPIRIHSEGQVMSLSQALEYEEVLPPLKAVEFSGSSTGMTVDSYSCFSEKISWSEGDPVLVTSGIKNGKGLDTCRYSVDSDVPGRIAEMAEKYKMNAWRFLSSSRPGYAPVQVCDFSSRSSITLTFGFGEGEKICTVSSTAIDCWGLGERASELISLIRSCIDPARLIGTSPGRDHPQYRAGKTGEGEDSCLPQEDEGNTWECPHCHTIVTTGRFCPECGSRKPE